MATHQVRIGSVFIGGGRSVAVQSMTNTDTADVQATVQQIIELHQAGSELVRITVNHDAAAAAVPKIKEALLARNLTLPLIGDFHFNGHRLLQKHPACAEALDKFRINPGNIGSGEKKSAQFAYMIEQAIRYDKAVRIGVNWGSMDKGLVAELMDQNSRSEQPLDNRRLIHRIMITSALQSAAEAERIGLPADRIVLSCKMSGVQDLIAVYQSLAQQCDYALHLGLTEAGMGSKGIIASTAALAILLQQGIGDTIRVSITPEPGQSRTQEVKVAQQILQSLELRDFNPQVIACPGCGRTSSDYFQHLAQDIQHYLEEQMPLWRQRYAGVEGLKVAVMGCVVNGPGESKHADIGISLPGTGEQPQAPVYIQGQKIKTLKGEGLADEFKQIIADYVQKRWG